MPRYEYRCLECSQIFEATHSMTAGPLTSCRLCGSDSVRRLISPPMINTLKSTSPTVAKYEKLSKKEVVDMEADPLAAMELQEGMAEKMAIMYGGKLD